MGLYKHLRELWKKPKENLGEIYRERLIKWRKEPTIVRTEKPTRLDRARSLGYKAKKGFVISRVRIPAGGRMRNQLKKGRRSKTSRRRLVLKKNYQWIAEERAQRRYKNLVVLNSYLVAHDSKHYWFEVILVDPERPEIKNDQKLNWVVKKANRDRVFKGKTSAGRKSRGLRGKGLGREKVRPSLKANKGRGK